MKVYEQSRDEFLVSTDKEKLQVTVIHDYLSTESYWAKDIPLETVQRCIDHSFCFGLYQIQPGDQLKQIGFARLVTDHASFAYLADVFILGSFRGNGLAKWMMGFIISNPELKGLRRWMLATRDAHGLYAQYGFTPIDKPERLMQIVNSDIYQATTKAP